MGGTSTDVALLKDGEARLAGEAIVHGYPIKAPMLDIHTVGAGGGSIAYVDSGGLLKVGPRSAGADPGPVCYGRGNTEPTVTDANVVLQTLNPHASARRPHADAPGPVARQAIGKLARQLGLGLMETAQGIISVVTANMAKAIRVITVQRGHDPRDYTLMAFGGAGPLHAARLAASSTSSASSCRAIPASSARWACCSPICAPISPRRGCCRSSRTCSARSTDAFAALNAQADAWFAQEEIAPDARRLARTVDMRYMGQNYELAVPLPDGPITPTTLDAARRGLRRRAPAHVRLPRRGRAGAARHLPRRGDRPRPQGRVEGASARRTGREPRDPREPREVWLAESRDFVDLSGLCPRRAERRQPHRRARRSSSRWMRPPWCCPA